MSDQDDKQAAAVPRPSTEDAQAWKAYWEAQGQPWRTEPEISRQRQAYLTCRSLLITPNIERGIYPFKDVETKLTRADIEWLLATHENGRGPVDWSDKSQRKREGLDLRGADLSQEDLRGLPLACMQGAPTMSESPTTQEQRYMAVVHLGRVGTGLAKSLGYSSIFLRYN